MPCTQLQDTAVSGGEVSRECHTRHSDCYTTRWGAKKPPGGWEGPRSRPLVEHGFVKNTRFVRRMGQCARAPQEAPKNEPSKTGDPRRTEKTPAHGPNPQSEAIKTAWHSFRPCPARNPRPPLFFGGESVSRECHTRHGGRYASTGPPGHLKNPRKSQRENHKARWAGGHSEA